MHTVAEKPIFLRHAASIWSQEEQIEFINWIASNPLAGTLIPGSGGCRKVRWSRAGMVYTKAKFNNLPTEFLAELKQGVEDGR